MSTPDAPAPTTEPSAPISDRERLARAEAAYEAGNFAVVRALTDQLKGSSDADLAKQAAELRARVSVDPVSLFVLGGALVLFYVIVLIYGA